MRTTTMTSTPPRKPTPQPQPPARTGPAGTRTPTPPADVRLRVVLAHPDHREHTMRSTSFRLPTCRAVLLAAALAIPAAPLAAAPTGINEEIRADMRQARREMRAELAAARADLAKDNLELGRSLPVGRQRAQGQEVPKGEITPAGDLLVDGRAVRIDPGQRHLLKAYRAQVVELALLGIDAGEQAAEAAIDAVDHGLFRLLFDSVTGRLERRV